MTADVANTIFHVLRDNAAVIAGIVAVVSLLINVLLSRRIARLHANLGESRLAAEEAARLAALSHPGGIDPEAVIEVLRRGIPPTLDNVYSVMRRRQQMREAEPEPADEEAVTSPS
ncbi:MAG TPA: hypothetical protein VF155_05370 [Candidatus Dormibacteraeota bacterium]